MGRSVLEVVCTDSDVTYRVVNDFMDGVVIGLMVLDTKA